MRGSGLIDLNRMPELFCGFDREPGEAPVPYPVACARKPGRPAPCSCCSRGPWAYSRRGGTTDLVPPTAVAPVRAGAADHKPGGCRGYRRSPPCPARRGCGRECPSSGRRALRGGGQVSRDDPRQPRPASATRLRPRRFRQCVLTVEMRKSPCRTTAFLPGNVFGRIIGSDSRPDL